MNKLLSTFSASVLVLSFGCVDALATSDTKSKHSKLAHSQSTHKKAVTSPRLASSEEIKPVAVSSTTSPEVKTTTDVKPDNVKIDCLYQLSPSTPISDVELTQWAQQAAIQSFDYSYDNLDDQLRSLKSCYTEQGWIGFNEALNKSGNLTAIKAQQLSVSSQTDGQAKISDVKNNQWNITVPLKVVYQNTQEKLIQSLSVEIVIAKKSETQLGISQLIAVPKTKEGQLISKS